SELLLCHGMVCVVGRMRDLILQLSKSSIYSTKPRFIHKARLYEREIKDSLSPITRIVTVCAQRQDAQY
ncbi:hypothetical protein ACVUSM_22335, partial [Escherichia coli]